MALQPSALWGPATQKPSTCSCSVATSSSGFLDSKAFCDQRGPPDQVLKNACKYGKFASFTRMKQTASQRSRKEREEQSDSAS